MEIDPFEPAELEEFDTLTDGYPGSFMVEVVRGATMRSVALGSGTNRLTYQDIRWGVVQLSERAKAYRDSVVSHVGWADGLISDAAGKAIPVVLEKLGVKS
jgi:hypothetical protein